jgi:hypothetical protein
MVAFPMTFPSGDTLYGLKTVVNIGHMGNRVAGPPAVVCSLSKTGRSTASMLQVALFEATVSLTPRRIIWCMPPAWTMTVRNILP